jgi:predicted DNA-binding transcriptional regulator AlpA
MSPAANIRACDTGWIRKPRPTISVYGHSSQVPLRPITTGSGRPKTQAQNASVGRLLRPDADPEHSRNGQTTTNELLDSTSEDALIEQASASPTCDQFVPDPQVARELGITMTGLWRYSNDPDQNFPPNIQIGDRTYIQIEPTNRACSPNPGNRRCCSVRWRSAALAKEIAAGMCGGTYQKEAGDSTWHKRGETNMTRNANPRPRGERPGALATDWGRNTKPGEDSPCPRRPQLGPCAVEALLDAFDYHQFKVDEINRRGPDVHLWVSRDGDCIDTDTLMHWRRLRRRLPHWLAGINGDREWRLFLD